MLENFLVEGVHGLQRVCGALRIEGQPGLPLLVLFERPVVSVYSAEPHAQPFTNLGGAQRESAGGDLHRASPHDVLVPQDTKGHQPGRKQTSPSRVLRLIQRLDLLFQSSNHRWLNRRCLLRVS